MYQAYRRLCERHQRLVRVSLLVVINPRTLNRLTNGCASAKRLWRDGYMQGRRFQALCEDDSTLVLRRALENSEFQLKLRISQFLR